MRPPVKKMNFVKDRLCVVIIAGAAVAAISLYLFLYRPLIKKLRVSSGECAVLEQQVRLLREKAPFLKNIEDKKKLVTEEDISIVIDEITRKGKINKIDFISIISGKTEEIKDGIYAYKRLLLEMETLSSYISLGRFLGALEKLERGVVTVNSFNIAQDKNAPDKIKAKLMLDIYFLAGK